MKFSNSRLHLGSSLETVEGRRKLSNLEVARPFLVLRGIGCYTSDNGI